jgi:hypothetical protein
VALREEEESQRMIQDATVSREEERIPSLLHTKPSGRRRKDFAILCPGRRHPGRRRGCRRSGQRKTSGRRGPSVFCVRDGDTQGGGEGAAALDNERPQGGGGSLSYSI